MCALFRSRSLFQTAAFVMIATCLLLGLFLVGVTSYSEFVLLPPPVVQVLEGESVNLPCVLNTATIQCTWRRNGVMIAGHEMSPDYGALGEARKGECSLRIRNANISRDEGIWQCNPLTQDMIEIESEPIKVKVLVPPSPPVLMVDDVKVHDNESFHVTFNLSDYENHSITCLSLSANPPSKLRWFLQEKLTPPFDAPEAMDGELPLTVTVNSTIAFPDPIGKTMMRVKCQTYHPANTWQSTSFKLIFKT